MLPVCGDQQMDQHGIEEPRFRSADLPKNEGLAVDYVRVGTLKPYQANARTHSRSQIRKIADSISEFGFINPVLVDKDGTIVAGHGRVRAAKLLKMDVIPTIPLQKLTPAQVRAYILADNRLAQDADWDEEILQTEIQKILGEGMVEIELTGFELPEIDALLGLGRIPEDDDQLPPDLPPARVNAGELWQLGSHRISCGDARDGAALDRLLDGHVASLVFIDPPFNVPIQGHVSGNGRVLHPEFAMASGEMSDSEFTEFLAETLSTIAPRSSDGSVHYVCMDWRGADKLLTAGKKVYQELLNVCVWVKPQGGMGSMYRSQHEMVFVFKNGSSRHRNNVQLGKFGRNRTNVWEYPSAGSLSRAGTEGNLLAMHPTVKPIGLVADAILDASARGEIVLDTFLGAGTTLLAAERVGRRCFGMEINTRYVDLAIQRWESLTGEKAVLITAHPKDDVTSEDTADGQR